MDDILVAAEHQEVMEKVLTLVTEAVSQAGLCIASEKVQEHPPSRYLGSCIGVHSTSPQNLPIQTNIHTLHDAQKLLGAITWVCSLLGISNAELSPLFELLKGDSKLLSPRLLNLQAQQVLQGVSDALVSRQAACWAPELPFLLIILCPAKQPYALTFQWDSKAPDPLL
ncbi:hypothetical protein Nmel_007769, partial [Mimus melanotis]